MTLALFVGSFCWLQKAFLLPCMRRNVSCKAPRSGIDIPARAPLCDRRRFSQRSVEKALTSPHGLLEEKVFLLLRGEKKRLPVWVYCLVPMYHIIPS
ncbi:hypothetical protein GW17_00011389 [Ensete ventricosum]|nr:hypothetical protein GW17_00011389 [Ensete ventricosum]